MSDALTETEMGFLIAELPEHVVVKFDFGTSGARLSEDQPEAEAMLQLFRDEMTLTEHHRSYKL